MTDNHEKIFEVVLDLQKQLSVISRETGEQSKLLISIKDDTAKHNGRMTKAEEDIKKIQIRLSDYEEIRDGTKDVVTTKKALLMIAAVIVFFSAGIYGLTKYVLKTYINEVVSMSLTDTLSSQVNSITIEQ